MKYQFNDDFEFKDRIKNTSKTTIFSVSPTGNYYINNNQVELKQEKNPIFSPMDSGGYWELTYYNCDSSYQCYMYTGSGVSFDLNTVENAYKEVYLVKNSTNNPTISDFKLYATQVANARDSYWDAGAAYSLAIIGVAGSIPFANALLAIGSGGVAIYEAYKGYSAWQDINEAMSNAYSII